MDSVEAIIVQADLRGNLSEASQAAVRDLDRLDAAARKVATTTGATGDAAQRVSQSFGRLEASLDGSVRATNAKTAADARLVREMAVINASVDAGAAGQARANTLIEEATRRRDAYVAKVRQDIAASEMRTARLLNETQGMGSVERAAATMATALSGVGNSARLTAREMQMLSPQIADVGVTLLGGMNPLMVLVQQGPQMTDAVGGIGRAFTLLRTAAFSVTGATVAAVAGIATVGIVAESQTRALAELSNRLRLTRADYEDLAQTTENAARRVAATTSMGTGDARVAGRTIAGSRNFTGSETELRNLTALAGRLATVMGTDAATAAGKLAEALERPRQAAEAMANSGLRTMDEALVRTIRSMENQGRVVEAGRLVMDAYNRAIGEVAKTPLQRATEALSQSFTVLWQQVQPVLVGIGTVLVDALALAVGKIADMVSGISRLGTALRESSVARFLLGDVAPAVEASAPAGETSQQRQVRLAREANPRWSQQRDNREQYGAARDALPGLTGDDARVLRSRITGLAEEYRGLQGPVADVLKGLREQVAVARELEGADRAVAQAMLQMKQAGGGMAEQLAAGELALAALREEFYLANEVITRNVQGLTAQGRAVGQGATATDDARLAAQAYTEVTRALGRAVNEESEEYRTRLALLKDERNARAELASLQNVQQQQDQLALIQRETELVGAGVVVRERELAVLRERQRILATPGADINSQSSQDRLANAESIVVQTQALERQRALYGEIERVGTQAFDRIGSALTTAFANGTIQTIKMGNILRAVASEALQAFMRIALLNPIRNAVGGSNLPTMFGGGGSGGSGSVALTPDGNGGFTMSNSSSGSSLLNQGRSMFSGNSLGKFFPGGNAFDTGFSSIDGVLNTSLVSSTMESGTNSALAAMGPAYGPALPSAVAEAGGYAGLSFGQALGPAASIVGGGYSVYSGLKRGGPGGYTSAAGGAVTAVTGAAMLGSAMGFLPALGMLGPIGLVLGAILAIVGSLLPGEKPSGKGQEVNISMLDGTENNFGLQGKRFSQDNQDYARRLATSVANVETELEKQLGFGLSMEAGAGVTQDRGKGNEGGKVYLRIGEQRADFTNDEAGAKAFGEKAGEFLLNEFKTASGAGYGDKGSILRNSGSVTELGANLDWYESVYKGFTGIQKQTTEFAESLKGLVKPFDEAIAKATSLGLSVTTISDKRGQALEDALAPMLGKTASVQDQYAAGLKAIKENYEATIRVVGELGRATDDLREAMAKAEVQFQKGLQGQFDSALRDAKGQGYIDQIGGIRQEYDGYSSLYRAAGREPADLYTAKLDGVLKGLDEAGLKQVILHFRGVDDAAANAAAALLKLAGAANDAPKSAKEAQSRYVQALDAEIAARQQSVDSYRAAAEALRETVRGFRLDENLSTLTPMQKMAESQARYAELLAKSRTGTPEDRTLAAQQLQGMAGTRLGLASGYYAPGTEAYVKEFDEVNGNLSGLADEFGRTATIAEMQLNIQKEQRDIAAKFGAETVKSIDQLRAEFAAVAQQAGWIKGPADLLGRTALMTAGMDADGAARVLESVRNAEQAYLAANPDVAAGIARGEFGSAGEHYNLYGSREGRTFGGNSPSQGQNLALLMDATARGNAGPLDYFNKNPDVRDAYFATGATDPAAFAKSHYDNYGRAEGRGGMAALVEEVKALRTELASQTVVIAQGAMAVKGSVDGQTEVLVDATASRMPVPA